MTHLDRGTWTLAAEVQELAPTIRMDRQTPRFGSRWADQMQLEARHAQSLRRLTRGAHPVRSVCARSAAGARAATRCSLARRATAATSRK